jgi:hypothetical protein
VEGKATSRKRRQPASSGAPYKWDDADQKNWDDEDQQSWDLLPTKRRNSGEYDKASFDAINSGGIVLHARVHLIDQIYGWISGVVVATYTYWVEVRWDGIHVAKAMDDGLVLATRIRARLLVSSQINGKEQALLSDVPVIKAALRKKNMDAKSRKLVKAGVFKAGDRVELAINTDSRFGTLQGVVEKVRRVFVDVKWDQRHTALAASLGRTLYASWRATCLKPVKAKDPAVTATPTASASSSSSSSASSSSAASSSPSSASSSSAASSPSGSLSSSSP